MFFFKKKFFTFLKSVLEQTWNTFNAKFQPQWKDGKSSYQVRQILGLFLPITRLILTTYCVRYPHAMPSSWNKIPYFLLKTPKTHAVWGRCSIINALNLKKMSGKNPKLCPLTGRFSPFLVIPHTWP